MNEHDELNAWHEKAENLIFSFSEDPIENIMLTAIVLRQTYIEGKIDGVHEWNNSER